MVEHQLEIRVRYGETDPMKYVYYGNYAQYLEVARVELFRDLGISYQEIEEKGIWLPVSEYYIKYLKSAKYDDLLLIKTFIKKKPMARIEFEYEIYNQNQELLSLAQTTLYFFDSQRQKIIKCPDFLMQYIEKKWKK